MIMNEDSAWEEPLEIEGLTLYDIHREPVVQNKTEGAVVSRPARSINMELTCPVCLGILHNTMIVMECLHRFCGECIQKCLRVGRKECPSCRIHIPSRRALRPDTNFDSIIAKVYPNLDEYEQHEEKMIEDFNRNRDQNNAFMNATQQGIQNQMLQRRKKTRVMDRGTKATQAASLPPPAPKLKRKSPGDTDNASQSNNIPAPKQTRTEFTEPETGDLVNFVLKRYPQCTAIQDLERTYLRTSCELKIQHMKKFLGLKLSFESYRNLEIIILAGQDPEPKAVLLDDELTLKDVCQHFWDGKNDLVLYFRVSTT